MKCFWVHKVNKIPEPYCRLLKSKMLFELPKELQINIFQFDSTYHCDYKECLLYLALPGTFEKIEDVDIEFNDINGMTAYSVLLREAFPEPNKTIDILNKCSCCPRHQGKKPKNIDDLSNEMYYDIPGQGWTNNACQCKCRHVSRWLCRSNQNCPDY